MPATVTAHENDRDERRRSIQRALQTNYRQEARRLAADYATYHLADVLRRLPDVLSDPDEYARLRRIVGDVETVMAEASPR